MLKLIRELRLVPVVLIASGCLFALKAIGLILDGGYTLGGRIGQAERVLRSDTLALTPPEVRPAAPEQGGAKSSWASEMFNFPDVTGTVVTPSPTSNGQATSPAYTGSTGSAGGKGIPGEAQPIPLREIKEVKPGTMIATTPARTPSASERAILERLHERRQELDARAREIELRESLLKAAEKKLEAKVGELKEIETRIGVAMQKKEENDQSRLKGLVTMYENMKAKDAAKIFDRLEMRILVEVASQINPRRMSDILAQMNTEAAEKLTIELANRTGAIERAPPTAAELPKIEGRPTQ